MTPTLTDPGKERRPGTQSRGLSLAAAGTQAPAVLIVDDDHHFRALARALLSPSFEVEEASSVAECVKRMESRPFDAVILDIVMPEQDGIEGIEEIRACASGTKIVAVSGSSNSNLYLILANKLGAHATLEKASIRVLRRLLEVVLEDDAV